MFVTIKTDECHFTGFGAVVICRLWFQPQPNTGKNWLKTDSDTFISISNFGVDNGQEKLAKVGDFVTTTQLQVQRTSRIALQVQILTVWGSYLQEKAIY